MTKHMALQLFLFDEKRALHKELADIRSHLEGLQRQLFEVQQELGMYPDGQDIEEMLYPELVRVAESATIVPDHLLMDDDNDLGLEEVTA